MYSNRYLPIWNPSVIPFESISNLFYNKNNKSAIEMVFYEGVDWLENGSNKRLILLSRTDNKKKFLKAV